jgi:hypothetical protein
MVVLGMAPYGDQPDLICGHTTDTNLLALKSHVVLVDIRLILLAYLVGVTGLEPVTR